MNAQLIIETVLCTVLFFILVEIITVVSVLKEIRNRSDAKPDSRIGEIISVLRDCESELRTIRRQGNTGAHAGNAVPMKFGGYLDGYVGSCARPEEPKAIDNPSVLGITHTNGSPK